MLPVLISESRRANPGVRQWAGISRGTVGKDAGRGDLRRWSAFVKQTWLTFRAQRIFASTCPLHPIRPLGNLRADGSRSSSSIANPFTALATRATFRRQKTYMRSGAPSGDLLRGRDPGSARRHRAVDACRFEGRGGRRWFTIIGRTGRQDHNLQPDLRVSTTTTTAPASSSATEDIPPGCPPPQRSTRRGIARTSPAPSSCSRHASRCSRTAAGAARPRAAAPPGEILFLPAVAARGAAPIREAGE